MRLRLLGCLISVFAVAAFAACSSDGAPACRVGADCASGVCGGDGRCVAQNGAAPPPPGTPPSGDGGVSPSGDAGTGDAALPGCTPNHDATITKDEVPIGPGLRATFRVATDVDVTTAGATGADGKKTWDLSGAFGNDANVLVETQALASQWFVGNYAGASYVTKLAASSDLIGVFETSPTSLVLRGVVSPADGLTKTELTYSPSAAILSFPLKSGASWSTNVDVSGTASGYPASYTEKYDSKVDAEGKLITPLGTFDVLRVGTVLTRTVGLVVTTIRTFAFVSECYGTVATITSSDNESATEFTHAAEVRRIAP